MIPRLKIIIDQIDGIDCITFYREDTRNIYSISKTSAYIALHVAKTLNVQKATYMVKKVAGCGLFDALAMVEALLFAETPLTTTGYTFQKFIMSSDTKSKIYSFTHS